MRSLGQRGYRTKVIIVMAVVALVAGPFVYPRFRPQPYDPLDPTDRAMPRA